MKELFDFLKSQKVVSIATQDSGSPWIANVYYGIDEDFKFYFISSKESKHSQHILKNPSIAFSVCWFDPHNHKNRKAVQGLGTCRLAQSEEEVARGVTVYNQNFPESTGVITIEWIQTNEFQLSL